MSIRIRGLVRIFNEVRQKLTDGIPEAERITFHRYVQKTLRQVEDICRQHALTPDALPAPSRNAYHFLKNFDFSRLPVMPASTLSAEGETVRVANIVKMGAYLSEQSWIHLDPALSSVNKFQELHQAFRHEAKEIERICREMGASPLQLPRPSLKTYRWFRFLSAKPKFTLHLKGLRNAKNALEKAAPNGTGKPIQIHLNNMRYIYRIKNNTDVITLKCSQGLQSAPAAVWAEVVGALFSRRKRAHPRLNAFVISSDYIRVISELNKGTVSRKAEKGQYFDLHTVFERVNQHYFDGQIQRPHLHWNNMLTLGKMGHYHFPRDEIMLSISLDQAGVPDFVVDFVMYHELLHKKHGLRQVNGRNIGHTSAFRRDEQKFDRYRDAQAFLKKISLQQRRRKK